MIRLLTLFLLLLPTLALAGSANVNYNSTGSSGFRTTTDGTTNCTGSTPCNLANQTIWDSVSGANGLGITTNNAAKIEGVGSAGTAVGGILTVQGVASMTPLLAAQSGPWTINQGTAGASAWLVTGTGGTFPAQQSGPWVVQPGNTANTTAWLVTGAGGLFPAQQSGPWTVNQGTPAAWAVNGSTGTFPAQQSGPWNITNITGSVSLPTGAATSANQPTNVSQGSTTGSQTGSLTFGAVTSSAPSYGSGLSSPISLDLAGNLRVNCITGCGTGGGGGGTSSNYGQPFPSSGTAIGYSDGTNMVSGRVIAAGADTNSNTTPQIVDAAWAYMFNGTTWDRVRGDTTSGLWVNVKGGTVAATQSGGPWTVIPGNTANTTAWLVTGTGGVFPAQQSGPWTVNPTTIGTWGLAPSTQNVGTPTNGMLVQGEFNATPATITSGNSSPLQLDTNGNLLVNIKAGAGAGGTSSSFNVGFPSAGTAIGLASGSPGNMIPWSATTNYGTAPAAISVPAVNAYVTNTNSNGQKTMANSSPVVVASDQAAIPVTINGPLGQAAMAASIPVTMANNQTAFSVNSTIVGPLGQAAMAASVPVTIANNQTFVPGGGAATSSAPTYTTGTNNPLSLDLSGNLRVNVTNTNPNGSATMANSTPVTVSSDQTGSCTGKIAINQTASTDLLTSVAKLNICSIVLISAIAQNISLVEGTGTTCATGIAALIGGSSASMAVAANGGFSAISGTPWLKTQTTADHLCLLQSGSGNISGIITYLDHS